MRLLTRIRLTLTVSSHVLPWNPSAHSHRNPPGWSEKMNVNAALETSNNTYQGTLHHCYTYLPRSCCLQPRSKFLSVRCLHNHRHTGTLTQLRSRGLCSCQSSCKGSQHMMLMACYTLSLSSLEDRCISWS